jgi:hypothetical protein
MTATACACFLGRIPGWFWTIVGCLSLFAVLFALFLRRGRGARSFYFDPQDYAYYEKDNLGEKKLPIAAMEKASTFAPLLEGYIGVAKLIITLAAASIAFGGNQNSRPGIFIAKIVLSFSILYGVTFTALLQYFYDDYTQDVNSYLPRRYALIQALGFSTLGCFVMGYFVWAFNLG